jgi:Ion channel
METVLRIAASVVGFVLIGVVFFDVVRTALSARGHGPILRFIHRYGWATARKATPAGALGPTMLLAGFLAWALLLWIGWTLVFTGSADSVLHGETSVPANLLDRVYYVGFNITTLGIGDFVPNGWVWKLLSICAAVSGFFVLTLGLTFVVSLLPTVVRKRLLARKISALGRTPNEIISRQWHAKSCQLLLPYIPGLVETLEELRVNYVAYPVLHFFFSPERSSCLALQLAKLNETLLLFESGAVVCEQTARAIVPLRNSLNDFLHALDANHPLRAAGKAPGLPALTGMPSYVDTNDKAEIAAVAAALDKERRLLSGYIETEGYRWADIYSGAA